MGTFEINIVILFTMESNCPTNVSVTYGNEAVTVLTNFVEDEIEVTTNRGETYACQVTDAQLFLEKYKQAQLNLIFSMQVDATDRNEALLMTQQIVSKFKNGVYKLNDFLLYNEEEDEVYQCQIDNIKEISVPVELILELELAV